jgi:hypothetical protein
MHVADGGEVCARREGDSEGVFLVYLVYLLYLVYFVL